MGLVEMKEGFLGTGEEYFVHFPFVSYGEGDRRAVPSSRGGGSGVVGDGGDDGVRNVSDN